MADKNEEFKKYFDEGFKYLEKGQSLLKQEKLDDAKENCKKAIEFLEKAVQIDPENEKALFLLGAAYSKLGLSHIKSIEHSDAIESFSKTIEKYQKAHKINPNNEKTISNLGISYLNLGAVYLDIGNSLFNSKKYNEANSNFNKAIEIYQKAIEFIPKNEAPALESGKAYSNLGVSHLKLKEFKEAKESFNKVIECFDKDPKSKQNFGNLGKAFLDLGNANFYLQEYNEAKSNITKAIANFKKAAEINPKHEQTFLDLGGAYYNLGNVYFNLKNFDSAKNSYSEAIKNLEKAIQINPKNEQTFLNLGNAHLNLGVSHLNLKEKEDAKNNFKKTIEKHNKAIEINPKNEQAFLFWTVGYSLLDKEEASVPYRTAIEYLCKAYTINKNSLKQKFPEDLIIDSLLNFIDKKDKEYTLFDFYIDLDGIGNFFIDLVCRYQNIIRDKNGNEQKNYKELLYSIYELWKSLRLNKENEDMNIYQYTNEVVLNNLIGNQKLRLTPADYQNDPKEGKTLFDFLKEKAGENTGFKKFIEDISKSGDNVAFIRCFTELEDDLIMWNSSYAQNGAGIAIGIKTEKINKGISGGLPNIVEIFPDTSLFKSQDKEKTKGSEIPSNPKQNSYPKDIPIENIGLYEVLYLPPDKEALQLLTKDEILYKETLESLKEFDNSKILEDSKIKEFSEKLKELDVPNVFVKLRLLERLEKLDELFNCLNKINPEDFQNEEIVKLIASSLIPIKHLIKDESYSHEKEVRLLYVGNIKKSPSKDYILQNCGYGGIYIETEPVLFKDTEVKEIIYLGPKKDGRDIKRKKIEHLLAFNGFDDKANIKDSKIEYR